ncbi:unnamed protein product [Zymoseptoria tritici ST99CH_1A5]|uniref:Uncharacterized protein n=3 Tax=Zymoseptoria tritici TaxID=1047171 RepID=F9XKB0_ZYMTI|nr:uncharacterized protein MYCGRDRAFT_95743 [Zymoseptoria tritici IPO323]EGP84381.1 hypothetical protein MYCGRDRAFT_95743 [Zymoseptoria tritici IPO323]SMR58527.1 unnamed protein product [Zymoseptoria tritici ST99CH_1E4]SMR61518.1 unnamed protein product [Zymoseptoria tritici ST99CH_3D1]SMY27728.1 unnamed protein product [Zymoseptoria tritici ST99CH_1A5]
MAHNFSTVSAGPHHEDYSYMLYATRQTVTDLSDGSSYLETAISCFHEEERCRHPEKDTRRGVHRTKTTKASIPPTSADPSTIALRAHLESLPQELYDDIYNLTFTVDSICRGKDQITQQDLQILQVNRATRHRLLPDFFAGGLKTEYNVSMSKPDPKFPLWIMEFPDFHKPLIDNFECHCEYEASIFAWRASTETHRKTREKEIMKVLLHRGFCVKDGGWQGCVRAVFLDD